MAEMWYYTCEGKQMEPVTDAELKRLAASGMLKPTDMVWKEGMPKWVRASLTSDLFSDAPISVPETPAGRNVTPPEKHSDVARTGRRDQGSDASRDDVDRPRRDRRRDPDRYDDEDEDRPRRRRRVVSNPGMDPTLKVGLILGGSLIGIILIAILIGVTFRSRDNGWANVKKAAFPVAPPPVPMNPVPINPNLGNAAALLITTYNVNLANNNAKDSRAFQLKAGARYQVTARSRQKGAFKVSILNNNLPLGWTTSVGATANLLFTAPHAGLFTIQTENQAVQADRITVTLREVGAGNFQNNQPAGNPPPVYRGPLEVGPDGVSLNDQLTAADARDNVMPSPSKVVTINMVAGKTYTIRHDRRDNNAGFDPYLRLEDSNFVQLAADDDSGGNLNALLIYQPAQTGVYRVIATSLGGTTGNFALRITVN